MKPLFVAGIAAFTLGLSLTGCGGAPQGVELGADARADQVAAQLLDEEIAEEERIALIEQHPGLAPALLRAMTRDLNAGTEEEYRRIPWIWRVAVDAGRRNDADELREIMELSLPLLDAPLYDWQAVVLGGGVVDGTSSWGSWPRERSGEILAGDASLQARWQRAVALAAAMADDAEVPNPTRYDALRMVAMGSWEERSPQLISYLDPGIDDELQRGAISGLADMRAPQVAQVLLDRLPHFSERGRGLVLTAMLRTDARTEALLDAVAAGRVTPDELGEERVERLVTHENETLRTRARRLLQR